MQTSCGDVNQKQEYEIGTRIRYYRESSNITQDQLAERIGVAPKTVRRWEKNISIPGVDMVQKIAEVFEISVFNLLGNEGSPQENEESPQEKNADILNNKIELLSKEMKSLYGNELKSFIGLLDRRIRFQKIMTIAIISATIIMIAVMTYIYWTL